MQPIPVQLADNRGPKTVIAASIAQLFDYFVTRPFLVMLLAGALHSHVAAIPAPSFVETWLGYLAIRYTFSSQTDTWYLSYTHRKTLR